MAELTPAKWKGRIDRSLKLLKVRMDEAERFQRAYMGDYGEKPQKGLDDNKDEAIVNFVFSFVETVSPTVFFGEPRVMLDPRNENSDGLPARHLQAVINYWLRELGAKHHFIRCRYDSFFGQAGILTEWDYEERVVEEPTILMVNPMTGKPVYGPPQKKIKIIRDQPLIKRVAPWDIILDSDVKTREEDRWRAVRILMTKSEFDSLEGVGSKLKKKVKAQTIPRELQMNQYSSESSAHSDEEWVVVYKIYDLENETVKLLPDCGDEYEDFAEVKDWPWFFEVENDPWPITVLESKWDPSSTYSFSEIKAFWNNIQERNRLRTMLQSHVRRLAPGWVMKKGALDEEEKKKFTHAKIGELVEAKNPEGITTRPMPEFPAQFFAHDNQVADDVVNVSGFYEYNNDSIADTATEASLLEGRSNIRKGERRAHFFDFVAKVGGKVGQLCQQYQDAETAVKIKDPMNPRAMIWVNATKEDIQGEFWYSAKPGVMEQKDEGLKRQQILKAAEVLGNNPHTDQRKLAERIAEALDWDPDEILRPQEEVAMEMQPPEEEKDPPLKFDKIKWEDLPPEVQAEVLQAALQQNKVQESGGPEGPDISSPTPSLAPPTPNSVMPGASINQAPPPLPGAMEPPMNPVQPMSEMQGGPQ